MNAKEVPPATRKLSPFIKVSIILLAVVSVAAISLLFIGDFEGRAERVFATLFTFAVFASLTVIDSRIKVGAAWYTPVALIANAYILALMLVVVWMTPSSWALSFVLFFNSLVIIIITRAVLLLALLLAKLSTQRPASVGAFALITSLLATFSGVLYTAPLVIDSLGARVLDLYWRISVAVLLLTALSFSITMLLRWAYGKAPSVAQAPVPAAAAAPAPVAAPAPEPAVQEQQELLPWPTYDDGRPLPIGPDGQPDFSVLDETHTR